jgi:branched-chain amino acid aminotransferase
MTETKPVRSGSLGFGALFTSHVISARYTDGYWSDPQLRTFDDLSLSPAAMVMHYGQAIFEGLKAFAAEDEVLIFRAADCARRFDRSAVRMGMPTLPPGLFVKAVEALVRTDVAEVPTGLGTSLYIRPVMFADEPSLAVRPATEFSFLVMASPVDSFFGRNRTMIDAYAQRSQIRAAIGGTGDVKCSGNYAGAMAAKSEAVARGCDEVLWLDAREHRYLEEFGAMNCFAVAGTGAGAELITPPLGGTILAGHTRDTILTLAARRGIPVLQRPIELAEVMAAAGPITEVFASGTAAGVAPVRRIVTDEGDSRTIGTEPGPVTAALAADYVSVTHGSLEPEPGWIVRIDR